jgi:hypothetical protein
MDGDTVDGRYYNACVENNNFTPIPLETIKKYFSPV